MMASTVCSSRRTWVQGHPGAGTFGSMQIRVQNAWATAARVTWRCQPANERPSKWSRPSRSSVRGSRASPRRRPGRARCGCRSAVSARTSGCGSRRGSPGRRRYRRYGGRSRGGGRRWRWRPARHGWRRTPAGVGEQGVEAGLRLAGRARQLREQAVAGAGAESVRPPGQPAVPRGGLDAIGQAPAQARYPVVLGGVISSVRTTSAQASDRASANNVPGR
jgi:hypothetical protein